MHDPMGDRMKAYEEKYTDPRIEEPYTYVRLDGRGFSKYTKGLIKPFDDQLTDDMQIVTQYLVEKTKAILGYTQSDEISLGFETSKLMFDGKIQKLASVLASMATAKFVALRGPNNLPHFDARVLGVPTLDELANMFLWRHYDCRRNAVSMTAQSLFSHKELQNKSTNDMLELIHTLKGKYYFSQFNSGARLGSFWKREHIYRRLTKAELDNIPEEYWPEGPVMRSVIERVLSNYEIIGFADIRKYLND